MGQEDDFQDERPEDAFNLVEVELKIPERKEKSMEKVKEGRIKNVGRGF